MWCVTSWGEYHDRDSGELAGIVTVYNDSSRSVGIAGVAGLGSTAGAGIEGVSSSSCKVSPSARALARAAAARFSSRSFRLRRASSESVWGFFDSFAIDAALCVRMDVMRSVFHFRSSGFEGGLCASGSSTRTANSRILFRSTDPRRVKNATHVSP